MTVSLNMNNNRINTGIMAKGMELNCTLAPALCFINQSVHEGAIHIVNIQFHFTINRNTLSNIGDFVEGVRIAFKHRTF